MGKKLQSYLLEMQRLLDSEKPIDDIEKVKKELLAEIEFWQHERLIHLIVTMLFGLLTMSVIIVLFFYESIPSVILAPVLLLFVLFIGLVVPYIKHYYVLENGVQRLYTIYEELTRRQNELPNECIPKLTGFKQDDKDKYKELNV